MSFDRPHSCTKQMRWCISYRRGSTIVNRDFSRCPSILSKRLCYWFSAIQIIRSHRGAVNNQSWGRKPVTMWVVKYSKSENGKWRYVNGDDCDDELSVYRCIDLWTYQVNKYTNFNPCCIGQCVHFNTNHNKIDNNLPCCDQRKFFCKGCGEYKIYLSMMKFYKLQIIQVDCLLFKWKIWW